LISINQSKNNSIYSYGIINIIWYYYLSDKKVIGISFGANVHFSLSETIDTAPAEQNFINKNMFSTLNLGIVIGN